MTHRLRALRALSPAPLLALGLLASCEAEDTVIGSTAYGVVAGARCDGTEERALAVDGCNRCYCATGTWVCTDFDCECSAREPTPAVDGCNTCTCDPEGGIECTTESCPSCPAGGYDLFLTEGCELETVWAREPTTSVCCQYASRCETPEGWEVFDSKEACQPEACSCDAKTTDDVGAATIELPLDCFCQGDSAACPNAAPPDCGLGTTQIFRNEGCGLLWYSSPSWSGGFVGGSTYWDAATGELVYSGRYSDVATGICNAFAYRFGEEPEPCDAVTTCQLCGPQASDVESCPAD